jgi:hypothetical protein
MPDLIKVSEIRARLEGCPALQEFVDYLAQKHLMLGLFDGRYGQILMELSKITEPK